MSAVDDFTNDPKRWRWLKRRSAFHQGQELCAPTKAEYICADQPVNFIFRLRQSGGPYIPVTPSSRHNPETCRGQHANLKPLGCTPLWKPRCIVSATGNKKWKSLLMWPRTFRASSA